MLQILGRKRLCQGRGEGRVAGVGGVGRQLRPEEPRSRDQDQRVQHGQRRAVTKTG